MSKKLHGFLRKAQIICVICGQMDKQDIRNALTLKSSV
jgi:hypothetical protein